MQSNQASKVNLLVQIDCKWFNWRCLQCHTKKLLISVNKIQTNMSIIPNLLIW